MGIMMIVKRGSTLVTDVGLQAPKRFMLLQGVWPHDQTRGPRCWLRLQTLFTYLLSWWRSWWQLEL